MSDKQKRRRKRRLKLRAKQEEELRRRLESEERIAREQIEPEVMIRKGYEISNEEIASGAFSTCFKAKLKDKLVLVRIVEKEDKDKEFLTKFLPRMTRILRALDNRHTNIIRVLDLFETTKRVIIFMEWAVNGTVYDFLDKDSDLLNVGFVKRWTKEMTLGLCYLHINGIVHRDLRTENLLLDKNNVLKISGFTYSRLWIEPEGEKCLLSNTCCGTGPYCAPELLNGEAYDPRTTDIWSYGVVLFLLLNKKVPFDYFAIHVLVSQQKKQMWINRMRPDLDGSGDDLKALLGSVFDVNHKKRVDIHELVKHKWLELNVKIVINETNADNNDDNNGNSNEDNDNGNQPEAANEEPIVIKADILNQLKKDFE